MKWGGLLLLAALGGCKCGAQTFAPLSPPPAPVEVRIAYGSEKKTWFEEQAAAFQRAAPRTKSGRPIHLQLKAMGSGEAVQGILDGSLQPHVFSPASGAYIALLDQRWLSVAGRTKPISPAGEPVVLSPVVIAMWRPMAEALGWPGKQLGWSDLLRVARGSKGWAAFGRPEWGPFKFGHTHPEFSNSGLLGVLAEAYAGAGKTRGLTDADFASDRTRTFVAEVESAVVHYGKSTGFFAEKMRERGPSYLSAAVLYENLVVESYASPGAMPLVAVYPLEGTFWSDHPYAVLDAPWVGADEREGAEAFLAFLKAKPAQERAVQLGFRPADPTVPVVAPIDAAHGVDPKQPQTLLEVPAGPLLEKLLALWSRAKRRADVELAFDKSGSMNGRPLAEAQAGARAFLQGLHDDDLASLVLFDHHIYPTVGPIALLKGRTELVGRIDELIAGGGTALYDATASAYAEALARAASDPHRIHALVVMTDGRDENSTISLQELINRLSREDAPVKVFTIAYGSQADIDILRRIAEAGQGASVKGSAETIVQVYQDVAAFF